jgi:hypothetical protein
MRLHELFEEASAGATSAGDIAAVYNPQLAIGEISKSYAGSPGKPGTKAPKPPKVVQPKNSDGTAKNALNIKANLFGGTPIKRQP